MSAATGAGGIISTSIAQGGDLGDIALNLGTAYAFSFVGDLNLPAPASISAHAVVGGASTELAGGNFFDGALAAGVAKGTTLGVAKFYPDSVVANGAATAAAGAFAAKISGGDPALAAYRAGLGYSNNQIKNMGNARISLNDPQNGQSAIGPANPGFVEPMHPFFNPNNDTNTDLNFLDIFIFGSTYNPLIGSYTHPGADLRGYDINPYSGSALRKHHSSQRRRNPHALD